MRGANTNGRLVEMDWKMLFLEPRFVTEVHRCGFKWKEFKQVFVDGSLQGNPVLMFDPCPIGARQDDFAPIQGPKDRFNPFPVNGVGIHKLTKRCHFLHGLVNTFYP